MRRGLVKAERAISMRRRRWLVSHSLDAQGFRRYEGWVLMVCAGSIENKEACVMCSG